ncbi:MAG: HD domain-containing protein [Eubacterium sp.]|nr:HD domain-containing protein [Eubacterium sp.]
MKLSKKELEEFEEIVKEYKNHPAVLSMKKYIQHGKITTYDHCEDVAKHCFWINRRLKLGADENSLVIGAFLHDFYLYDWHFSTEESKGHATGHAGRAKNNAVKHFGVSEKIQRIIEGHMWPVNITKFPREREAAILVFTDKYCSLVETLFKRR